jgi:HlyD family secretion protein
MLAILHDMPAPSRKPGHDLARFNLQDVVVYPSARDVSLEGSSRMDGEKAQQLRSLTIDREGASAAPARRPSWRAAGVFTIVAAGAGLWFLIPQAAVKGQIELAAVAEKSAPEPAPAAQPRRAGSLVASGYVVARRKATIAAEITGKVVETLVEEGMVVEAGQVIARLDNVLAEKDLALAQSRANAAEAAIAAMEADLREAERVFERVQSLSQRNFASQADFTKAESRLAILRAQLRQTQAQLATARLDAQRAAAVLDKHQIRAPFSGIVVERSAQPGEMISPMSAGGFTRTGICTIVDMDSIEVEVDVNEAFIGRVSAGTKVGAILDAYPDWTIPGAVIAIVPSANREKATVRVRIGLQQKDPRILPDMAVKVTFQEDGRPGSAEQRIQSSSAN